MIDRNRIPTVAASFSTSSIRIKLISTLLNETGIGEIEDVTPVPKPTDGFSVDWKPTDISRYPKGVVLSPRWQMETDVGKDRIGLNVPQLSVSVFLS